MSARVIVGVVLVLVGIAIFGALLAAIYGGGPLTLVEVGMPGVLLGEFAGIAALCVGGAILLHATLVHRRRRRRKDD
jgi:hypothetical protein